VISAVIEYQMQWLIRCHVCEWLREWLC